MNEQELIKLHQAFFIVGDQAVLKILYELTRQGERTFSELRDNLHINPATLSKKLKLLQQFDIIAPDKSRDNLRVYYGLHESSRSIKKLLSSIERLSQELK